MRRLPVSFYAMATFTVVLSISTQTASAHQFTRQATASAGAINYIAMAQLSSNSLVTAVNNSTGNREVIAWQYSAGLQNGTGILSRQGTAYPTRWTGVSLM